MAIITSKFLEIRAVFWITLLTTAVSTSLPASTILIDDFTTAQALPTGTNRGAVSGTGIIGGERDVIFGQFGSSLVFNVGGGAMNFTRLSVFTSGTITLEWDGIQGGTGTPDGALGLDMLDLTDGGSNGAIAVDVRSLTADWEASLIINSGNSGYDTHRITASAGGLLIFPFENFGFADLTQVTGIQLRLRSDVASASIELGSISSTAAIPEPTHTSLILVGLGLAALQRRR